jgi:excisionase family DNA binding protein
MPLDSTLLHKSVYTTGEVADVCNVSQQTVIRCFDSGRLKGFRVPGSRFRRIPRDALIQFMKEHDIPLDRLEMGRKRVLVVDDDPAIVEMLVDLLGRDGRFEVQTADNGFTAGIKTKDFRPDVIVLDYMLPDINGDAVCRSVRSDPSMQSMKIIMVSGVVNPGDVAKLMEGGANEFLQKPFSIEELITKIIGVVDE